jgi:hypothetical protein
MQPCGTTASAAGVRRDAASCAPSAWQYRGEYVAPLRLVLLVGALALTVAACLAASDPKQPRPRRADVTITLGASSMLNVPISFFGLSTEYWAIPIYERRPSLFESVMSLLRVRGDGPMILRIGGNSPI